MQRTKVRERRGGCGDAHAKAAAPEYEAFRVALFSGVLGFRLVRPLLPLRPPIPFNAAGLGAGARGACMRVRPTNMISVSVDSGEQEMHTRGFAMTAGLRRPTRALLIESAAECRESSL